MDRKLSTAQEESLRADDECDLNELLTSDTPHIHWILNNIHMSLDRVFRLHGTLAAFATGEFAITEKEIKEVPNKLAKKHLDLYRDHPQVWAHSELFLSKTKGEFYADIDAAIVECGYSPEEVEQIIGDYLRLDIAWLKNRRDKKFERKHQELKKSFIEMEIRVFLALRKKGYTRYDLSS